MFIKTQQLLQSVPLISPVHLLLPIVSFDANDESYETGKLYCRQLGYWRW
jgi:hypothetical protein